MNRREKFLTCNTLAVIPLMLQGKSVLIDLRNETSVAGRIANADGLMNINLREVVFIDQKGRQYEFDEFMVPARMIRQMHLPANIDAVLAINSYFAKFIARKRPNDQREKSLKMKRAVKKHKEILTEICNSKNI